MQRAEMVLMRVGQHDAEEVAALLDQIADVRQDQVDAGQFLAGEGDAEIDGDPLPAALGAEAVEREIHPDLADAAERREDKFVAGLRHQRPSVAVQLRQTSPAAIVLRPPSGSDSTSRPASSMSSKRPTSSDPRRGARGSARRGPAARASQSARMVEKCSPPFHCARRPSILARQRGEQRLGA